MGNSFKAKLFNFFSTITLLFLVSSCTQQKIDTNIADLFLDKKFANYNFTKEDFDEFCVLFTAFKNSFYIENLETLSENMDRNLIQEGISQVENSIKVIRLRTNFASTDGTITNEEFSAIFRREKGRIAEGLLKIRTAEFKSSEQSVKLLLMCVYAFVSVIIITVLGLYFIARQYEKKLSENSELGVYAKYVVDGMERERNRISNDLHDSVLQDLKTLLLLKELDQTEKDTINSTIRKIRKLCTDLNPAELQLAGKSNTLISSIQALINNFNITSGIVCTLKIQDKISTENLTLNQISGVFRILQESFNNIKFHSKATKASVVVRNGNINGENTLLIYITDNGIGFNLENAIIQSHSEQHFGLENMKVRAKSLGATFSIVTGENEGTEIRLEFKI